MTSDVVCEIFPKAAQSVIKSKLYGDKMTKLISEADLKPSDLLVSSLCTLYHGYCEKLDRDKLVKKTFTTLYQFLRKCSKQSRKK